VTTAWHQLFVSIMQETERAERFTARARYGLWVACRYIGRGGRGLCGAELHFWPYARPVCTHRCVKVRKLLMHLIQLALRHPLHLDLRLLRSPHGCGSNPARTTARLLRPASYVVLPSVDSQFAKIGSWPNSRTRTACACVCKHRAARTKSSDAEVGAWGASAGAGSTHALRGRMPKKDQPQKSAVSPHARGVELTTRLERV